MSAALSRYANAGADLGHAGPDAPIHADERIDLGDHDESPIISPDDAFDHAQSLAHDPDALDQLQADAKIDYSRIYVKINGQQTDLFGAAEYLRLRVMAGRHAEADCIARDMTDAIAAEIADMLISRRL